MKNLLIRKSGGSAIVSISKNFLDAMGLKIGDKVEATLENKNLVLRPIAPKKRHLKKYDLHQLLDEQKQIMPLIEKESKEWLNMKSVGTEIL